MNTGNKYDGSEVKDNWNLEECNWLLFEGASNFCGLSVWNWLCPGARRFQDRSSEVYFLPVPQGLGGLLIREQIKPGKVGSCAQAELLYSMLCSYNFSMLLTVCSLKQSFEKSWITSAGLISVVAALPSQVPLLPLSQTGSAWLDWSCCCLLLWPQLLWQKCISRRTIDKNY